MEHRAGLWDVAAPATKLSSDSRFLGDLSPSVHALTDKPSALTGIQITWMILVKRSLSIIIRGSFKAFLSKTATLLKPPANCIFYFSILVSI